MSGEPVLKVEGLDVFYGGIQALRGVGLEVRPGELVTLIGANGAGKSTTLKTISGILTPRTGKVFFEGREITGRAPHLNIRAGLALCPEGRRIFPNLTVDENLDLGAYVRKDGAAIKSDIELMHKTFPILLDRARQFAGTLSGGEQQMLAMARALMSRPKLLMLDEPSLGLAPKLVDRIFEVLRNLKSQGVTILLVEQNARQALDVADRGYVLETGKVVKSGPARELAVDPAVRKAYLGG
ncbi:MAG: ABC transporter ATP-binding protein [Planctomycetes bacterium]|nr:ABC transporter ATP-binding protein [Planctomycetota bacterium]